MGDPAKFKKKYSLPPQMWQKERIDEEKALIKEYGLKNKREIWKADSLLRNFARQVKRIIAERSEQSEKEKNQLLKKLKVLGIVSKEADITAVLSLSIKDILNRRLQTIVYKKDLARTVRQARQLVVHRHISVGKKTVSTPSYLVRSEEDANVNFRDISPFASDAHPERGIGTEAKKNGP